MYVADYVAEYVAGLAFSLAMPSFFLRTSIMEGGILVVIKQPHHIKQRFHSTL